MRLWSYPETVWQWAAFLPGAFLFWAMLPIWVLCSLLWWRRDSLFMIIHVQAIFYNPWLART